MPHFLIPVVSPDERHNARHESGALTAYLASINGSLTATTLTLPWRTLFPKNEELGPFHNDDDQGTHEFRKTCILISIL